MILVFAGIWITGIPLLVLEELLERYDKSNKETL